MTDYESHVIVAHHVTQDENDVRQLEPMLARVKVIAGAAPGACTADAGYWSEANAALENDDTELFIATTKSWKQKKELAEQGRPRDRMPRT